MQYGVRFKCKQLHIDACIWNQSLISEAYVFLSRFATSEINHSRPDVPTNNQFFIQSQLVVKMQQEPKLVSANHG